MLGTVDFLENATIEFKFSTNTGGGAAVNFSLPPLEPSDIKIYKDASLIQRTSESGFTIITNFDNTEAGLVGIHHITIDLSDNTDVSFYAPGHTYQIILDPTVELVDENAVTHVLLEFGIENNGDTTKHEGAVWFDSGATANTNTKLGTDGIARRPVTTFGSAKTIADALGTKRIKIKGTATLTQNLNGYILEAWNSGRQFAGSPDILNLNGAFTYENLHVKDLSVNSDGTSTIADSNVWVNTRQLGPSDLGGTYENGSFVSELYKIKVDTVINGGFAFKETGNTVSLSLANNGTVLVVNNLGANISIQDMTLFDQGAFVQGSSIHNLFLSSSNTDGTIDISGVPEIIDQTAGATVILRFYTGIVSGTVDSNLISILGTPQSATDLKDFADDGYDPGTNKVQGVVLVDTTTTNTDMLTTAAVNTEVDTALADINLDHLLFNVAIDANVTNDSLWAQLTSKAATPDYSTFDNITDSLEALADMSAPSAETIADAVWDELTSGHVIAGSFGKLVSDINVKTIQLTFTVSNQLDSNLVSIEGSATIDTLGITTMFENIISHAQRDVVRVGNTYTYKKQDGTTTTFEYTVSAAGRT